MDDYTVPLFSLILCFVYFSKSLLQDIRTKYGEIRTRQTANMDAFHVVVKIFKKP